MLRDIIKLLRRDDLQAQALQECHEMLDLCEEMVAASIDSLRNRDDGTVDYDIVGTDKKLNAFERDVRRKVMTHLALGNPGDLSAGLVLVSIVVDLERIGDYSKNIYDLAVNHPKRLLGREFEDQLKAIETETTEILRRASHAFKTSDEDEARALMVEYKDDISVRCRRLEEQLVGGAFDFPGSLGAALALYMRFLKRIAAHTRNLASSVVNPFDRIGYPE